MQDDTSSGSSCDKSVTINAGDVDSSSVSSKTHSFSVSSSASSNENDNNLIRTRTRNIPRGTNPTQENETKEEAIQNVSSSSSSSSENESNESDIIFLPGDPREWDPEHIEQWLNWATKQFKIDPALQKEKFPETGVEICQMTKADFWVCAGTKYGAEKLAKYLAHSLYKVTGKEDKELLSDEDPSE